MTNEAKPTVNDVYNFWNENFLYSFEIDEEPGTKEFYDAIHRLRVEDIERYSYNFWEFNKHPKEKVLDIGCGPGWLVRNYATNGADIYAVDITDKAVELTRKMLDLFELHGTIQVGNAEELPFEDDTFDFISSSGVLHHTPDMQKAVDEVYRVLKPGHRAVISVYYKNILLHPKLFPLFLKLYRLFKPNVPGRDKMMNAEDPNDFIRMYDGEKNPVGYGLTLKECKKMFGKFELLNHEVHFFPKRFIPPLKDVPECTYKFLDNNFGTMIFLNLRKRG